MDRKTPFGQLYMPGGIYLVCGSQGAGVQVHRRSALPPPTHVLMIPPISCSRRRSAAACLAQKRWLCVKVRGQNCCLMPCLACVCALLCASSALVGLFPSRKL